MARPSLNRKKNRTTIVVIRCIRRSCSHVHLSPSKKCCIWEGSRKQVGRTRVTAATDRRGGGQLERQSLLKTRATVDGRRYEHLHLSWRWCHDGGLASSAPRPLSDERDAMAGRGPTCDPRATGSRERVAQALADMQGPPCRCSVFKYCAVGRLSRLIGRGMRCRDEGGHSEREEWPFTDKSESGKSGHGEPSRVMDRND